MSVPGDSPRTMEYCELEVKHDAVSGDDRKQRGWHKDGIALIILEDTATGSRRIELDAAEGAQNNNYTEMVRRHEGRRAVVGFLNQMAAEGWRVIAATPGTDSSHTLWRGFLLVRETGDQR